MTTSVIKKNINKKKYPLKTIWEWISRMLKKSSWKNNNWWKSKPPLKKEKIKNALHVLNLMNFGKRWYFWKDGDRSIVVILSTKLTLFRPLLDLQFAYCDISCLTRNLNFKVVFESLYFRNIITLLHPAWILPNIYAYNKINFGFYSLKNV